MSKIVPFAPNFMPIFVASDLFRYCNSKTRKPKTELAFVLKYHPFSKYKHKTIKRKVFMPFEKISSPEDKLKIKKELETEFSDRKNTKFNDMKVFEKIIGEKMDSSSESETNMVSSEFATNYIKNEFGKASYLNSLKHEIRTERGRQLEKNIIDKVNAEDNTQFVLDGSTREMNFDTFIIRARCDGIDLNARQIIEIKTKSKVDHESNTMELKERVQCLTMMKLSGIHSTLLVESDQNGVMKKIPIKYNEDEFIERIHNGLKDFSIKYRNITEYEFIKVLEKFFK